MPVQNRIDFPVRKGLRSQRKSVKANVIEPPNSSPPPRSPVDKCREKDSLTHLKSPTKSPLKSPSKRSVQDENAAADSVANDASSPSKRAKNTIVPSYISSAMFPSSPRLPLSPRKDIIFSRSCSNSCNSPSKNPATPRRNDVTAVSDIMTRSRTTPRTPDMVAPLANSVVKSSSTRRNLSSCFSGTAEKPLLVKGSESENLAVDENSNARCVSAARRRLVALDTEKIESDQRSGVTPLRLVKDSGEQYSRTKQVLHTALPSEELVGRCTEKRAISDFLEQHVSELVPGSLYVSGAPGTGKTAVLLKAIDKLKTDEGDSCKTIYINCMSLRNAHEIYKTILASLVAKTVSTSAKLAAAEIERCLCNSKSMVLLVLDEMDSLDSKNQDILYTMFEWPTLTNSKLVLIGIANSLDLTDRVLPRLHTKVGCRPTLLHFPPYSRNEIAAILNDRLNRVEGGDPVLDQSAVQMCARKVASLAGDARSALDVCRRAVEAVETDARRQLRLDVTTVCSSPSKRGSMTRKVGLKDILKVVGEASGGTTRVGTQTEQPVSLPLQQTIAICTLLLMTSDNGKKALMSEVLLGKFHECFSRVCRQQGVNNIDQSEFLTICELVESRGIFALKKGRDTRSAKVSLKMDKQELEAILQDKTLMSTILKKGLPDTKH